ncbi:MAG: LuxR family transcriptional regulator [Nevskia sp.]|nr:LuxR family transcriptional regulator [Nevskia sp.]
MNDPAQQRTLEDPAGLMCRFASELEQVNHIDAAMDVLHGAVRRLGFDMVDYSYVPVCLLRDGQWASPPLETRNFPRDWAGKWQRHSTNDPYYHACLHGNDLWVDWWKVQQRSDLSADERSCLDFLGSQQMHQGVTIPIRLPAGQLAFVSGIGGRPPQRDGRIDEQVSRNLFAVAHYFHNAASEKRLRRAPSSFTSLSDREVECLAWAARGKTAENTALILGRSVETVRVHLKHAIAKLGAANCAHAAAKATFLGIIDP